MILKACLHICYHFTEALSNTIDLKFLIVKVFQKDFTLWIDMRITAAVDRYCYLSGITYVSKLLCVNSVSLLWPCNDWFLYHYRLNYKWLKPRFNQNTRGGEGGRCISSYIWRVFGWISSTVESRCSYDVVRTVSVLLSSAGFNLISVTGKFCCCFHLEVKLKHTQIRQRRWMP